MQLTLHSGAPTVGVKTGQGFTQNAENPYKRFQIVGLGGVGAWTVTGKLQYAEDATNRTTFREFTITGTGSDTQVAQVDVVSTCPFWGVTIDTVTGNVADLKILLGA